MILPFNNPITEIIRTIQDPAGFIIGAAGPGVVNLVDYGFALETIILCATGIGLGPCWLGGNFTKSSYSKRIKATRDEIIPAARRRSREIL